MRSAAYKKNYCGAGIRFQTKIIDNTRINNDAKVLQNINELLRQNTPESKQNVSPKYEY